MKKTFVYLLTVLLAFSMYTPVFAIPKDKAATWHYGNISKWAQDELVDAVSNEIVLDNTLLNDCKKNITRQEFATLAVNMYTAIKREDPSPASISTFTDTTNLQIRIAYNLGIINGKGNGLFKPNDFVTRQEMAVMMNRAVNALHVNYNKGDGVLVVKDKNKIASWAVQGADFAYENDFMKGDGINFNPLQTTTVEQAIAISNRVYKKYAKAISTDVPEKNDYTKGKTIDKDGDGFYVTYYNTNNKVCLFKYGKTIDTDNGESLIVSSVKSTHSPEYYRNIKEEKQFIVTNDGTLLVYDYEKEKLDSYSFIFGNVDYVDVVARGKYVGYYIAKNKNDSKYYAYDTDFNIIGEVASSDIYYSADKNIEEAYKFKFKINGDPLTRFGAYGGKWTRTKNLRLQYENGKTEGPMLLIANKALDGTFVTFNGGIYTTTLKFNNEDHSNAGIVFNVKKADLGNDNYIGYYAGISPSDNKVILGWSDYKWHEIKNQTLNFEVEKGVPVDLKVIENGNEISVYVNEQLYIKITDKNIQSSGGIGLRGWKADVSYLSFSADKLPY